MLLPHWLSTTTTRSYATRWALSLRLH